MASDEETLMALIRAELANIPLEHWGFFFPCQVAVWRFIQTIRPGVLGALEARFEGEPVFLGKGAAWFCERLGSTDEYLDQLEAIMYPITKEAPPRVRDVVRKRGFFRDEEIPPIDASAVARLSDVVRRSLDEAAASGALSGSG